MTTLEKLVLAESTCERRIAEALATEREACARIAEEFEFPGRLLTAPQATWRIAVAIRARSGGVK